MICKECNNQYVSEACPQCMMVRYTIEIEETVETTFLLENENLDKIKNN
jgi:hypothetical protein